MFNQVNIDKRNLYFQSFKLVLMTILLVLISLKSVYAASDLKVMTYNVNLLPNVPISPLTENLNHPYKRAGYIPYQIIKRRPDVVVFQEDIAPIMYHILNKHMKRVGFKYKSDVVGNWDLNHINLLNGGVIIYSRYPFAEPPQYLVYPKSYGWEAISNKGAVFAAVKKGNRVYNIIATHMQSIDIGSEQEEAQTIHWKNQVGALNQWIANLNLSVDVPLILLGDVNANSGQSVPGQITPVSEQYPLYQYLLMALNAKQIAPYHKNTLPYSFDQLTNDMLDGVNRETLDHILCIKGYLCAREDSSSVKNVSLKSNMLDVPDLSDHYAAMGYLSY